MTTVDLSHPRIQAYIKALKDYESNVPKSQADSGWEKTYYAAIVETEMKLTRFEVRSVHEYLAEKGE